MAERGFSGSIHSVVATTLISDTPLLTDMSDELFHCVCRSCGAEQIVESVADRGRFFEAHAEHSVLTTTLQTEEENPEPEGRIVLQASD
jgi:hypothetical protein